MRDYLDYIRGEARKRFDAGLSARDAAFDIALGDYASWGDAERIAVNVATLYREFANDAKPANVVELFGLMAELHRDAAALSWRASSTASSMSSRRRDGASRGNPLAVFPDGTRHRPRR